MKLSNVVVLYGVRLRARLGQELLALVGIAVGVSLLFAALVANTSLSGSFERMMSSVVGDAQFQVTAGNQTFDEHVVREVQQLDGVAAAAATIEVRTEVEGTNGRHSALLIGVTPEFSQLGGVFRAQSSAVYLARQRAIALPAPLATTTGLGLGQSVRLAFGDRSTAAPLGTILQEREIGSLVNSPVVLAPLAYAQSLSDRPDQITRIFVRAFPGREETVKRGLKQLAAGRANVRSTDYDAVLFRQASLPTNQSTGMFSVFSAMVGFLFAFSAVLLTVPQRRRLVADLHTEGYGPGTAVKILLVDALVLGLVASALGIVLGNQVSRSLFDATPSFLELAFVFGPQRIVTAQDVVIAGLGGVAASCIAVLAPTVSALVGADQTRPVGTQPGGGHVVTWLLLGGIACLALGTAVVVSVPDSANLGITGLALLSVAMLLLLPALLRLLVAVLEAVTRPVRSVVPFLAIADLRDQSTRVRSIAVAATGAVAVFGGVSLQGAHADLQRGLDRTSQALAASGDVWVVAPGKANLLATEPFSISPPTRPAGIEHLASYRAGFLDIGERRVWVMGAAAQQPIPHDGRAPSDAVASKVRAGGWAIVSEGVADDLGVGVGDRFTLPSRIPTSLRVAMLSTNLGWPPGAVVVNADDFRRAWGSDDVTALLATLAPGVTAKEGRRALQTMLGSRSELVVQTAAARAREQEAMTRDGLARLTQIAALVLVSAVIAMAAAMAGLIWQRRAFLAAMKVEGYEQRELLRALLLEAAVLISAGCVIGALFGLLGQKLLSNALTEVTGFPVTYALAASSSVLTCLLVTGVAMTIVAGAGFRAAGIAPESGLRD